jgi:hypothetical protein
VVLTSTRACRGPENTAPDDERIVIEDGTTSKSTASYRLGSPAGEAFSHGQRLDDRLRPDQPLFARPDVAPVVAWTAVGVKLGIVAGATGKR